MGLHPRAEGCDCHACRPDAAYDDPQDRSTIETVLRHGWQVFVVGSGSCDSCEHESPDHDQHPDHQVSGPSFAYTVGLGHRAGHPELVMSGLDAGLMHRALNRVAERVLAGRRFAAGDVLEDVLGRVPVVLAQATPEGLQQTVTWAGWFHRRPVEALVVVWPSTSAVFAWQPGAPAELDEQQPPAWRDPLEPHGPIAPDPEWTFPVPPDLRALTCTHVTDEGAPVLWVGRESDPSRGEDWSLHCGEPGHVDDAIVVAHLAHLVRGAPSVRDLADLPLDWEAHRPDVDSGWTTRPIARTS
jgi:hypothetical protein